MSRPSAPPLLEVRSLRCRYASRAVVNDLSFEVRRGEVLGFLGPNGAGKSTTMDAICGVKSPAGGEILLAGENFADVSAPARALIGYLPEHPPLYPELRVEEYLHFCACLRRVARAARSGAISRALEVCSLADDRRRLIGNLSKGFQQRVGIAQAIIHSPLLIVLDEPTTGLDPNQIRGIRSLVRELARSSAVILSTHLLPEVHEVCDRVLILHRGTAVYRASMAEFGPRSEVRSIRLTFEHRPSRALLTALPEVTRVDEEGDRSYRVWCGDRRTFVSALLRQTLEQNWALLELAQTKTSLEQTFVELTCKEPDSVA